MCFAPAIPEPRSFSSRTAPSTSPRERGPSAPCSRRSFAGQFFGELSLLDGSPRSATATATKPSTLQALDRDDFQAVLSSKPGAATKILAEMADRLRQTNALFSQQVSRDVLEEHEDQLSFGQRIADAVAAFGGLVVVHHPVRLRDGIVDELERVDGRGCVRSVSVHPLEPRAVDVRGPAGAHHHDEPEPPGGEGQAARAERLPREPQGRARHPADS